jgi:hypothetical protein
MTQIKSAIKINQCFVMREIELGATIKHLVDLILVLI